MQLTYLLQLQTFGVFSILFLLSLSIRESIAVGSGRNKESPARKPTFINKKIISSGCGTKCNNKTGKWVSQEIEMTLFPSSIEELTTLSPIEFLEPNVPSSTTMSPDSLIKLSIRKSSAACKRAFNKTETRNKKIKLTLTCMRSNWTKWLLKNLEPNVTRIPGFPFLTLVENQNLSRALLNTDLEPETLPENMLIRVIEKFGEPSDKALYKKVKKFIKSRELDLTIPNLVQVQVSPRTHPEGINGRTLFDPGFNLKLKLPFFHDEVKVAVSTGPSFLAGLGLGLIILGIKSIFSPFFLAVKALILSWFLKDLGPIQLVKSLTGHLLGGGKDDDFYPPVWETVNHYEPPHVHNFHDFGHDKKSHGGLFHGLFSSHHHGGGGHNSFDQAHQFTQENPVQHYPPPTLPPPPSHTPHYNHYNHHGHKTHQHHSLFDDDNEGRTQAHNKPSMNSDLESSHYQGVDGRDQNENNHKAESDSGQKYVPSAALQYEVENFDPFYSPLLSRIDSIFMHLGFAEEGCKERAVCSIYKFPVKYAPYSNLLSAQLSKHQSELKRPVTTSPKVLRYFKYMKAAKDGQASLDCLSIYPKCSSDTEKLSNLPMVKTFHQLNELMGAGTESA